MKFNEMKFNGKPNTVAGGDDDDDHYHLRKKKNTKYHYHAIIHIPSSKQYRLGFSFS
jgi:hypothetical protein